MAALLTNLVCVQIVRSADLYKTYFNATTPEEEASKYIAAGFGAFWITLIAGVIAYWLLRRRPVPLYTYMLMNEATPPVGVSVQEESSSVANGGAVTAGSQCRRRQISEVSLALSKR